VRQRALGEALLLGRLLLGPRGASPLRDGPARLRTGLARLRPLSPALARHIFARLIDQPEVRIHRLEVLRIGFAQVAVQSAEHGGRRRYPDVLAGEAARQVDAGYQSSRQRLSVSLDTGELPCEE